VDALTVSEAAARTGWSARMLRYLEQHALVVPRRSAAGYRLYALGELNQLHALAVLRRRFGVDLAEVAFAGRLRRDADLRDALEGWLAAAADAGSWIEWEQRKHERLLAA
jgi:MerR family copper efflux transcriptional regulator